jgi:chromosome segregation ATPase
LKTKKAELVVIQQKLDGLRSKLKQSGDQGAALAAYDEAQKKMIVLLGKITELESKDVVVNGAMTKVRECLEATGNKRNKLALELQSQRSRRQQSLDNIRNKEKAIESLESKEGTKCPTCFATVSKENYLEFVENLRKEIRDTSEAMIIANVAVAKLEIEVREVDTEIDKQNQNLGICKEKSSEIHKKIAAFRQEIKDLSKVRKPEAAIDEAILLQNITQCEEQIEAKKAEIAGATPYDEILAAAKEDVEKQRAACKIKVAELTEAEARLPYYKFMAPAFDGEIQKFVIDGVLSGLNNRISYWLQFLIDNKITLQFNNLLEECIERNPPDGDPYVYHAMSGGERRRINLAVSQAFAYIMMLSAGCSPSIVFLDEVTTNVDPIGVEGIYRMIQELAREKQVFVTTHDQNLLEKLSGCDSLVLRKKDGFTKLV